MIAILLAAGFATRLYPLTRDRAKPLLEVGGRPVLSHLLDRVLRVEGLREVRVVCNAKFYDQFTVWQRSLITPVPLHLIDDGALCDEEKLGGVADLHLAMRTPELPAGEPWMVVAGDNLLEFELEPYAATFRASGAPLVLARTLQPPLPPRRFGEITVDERGRITRFREKPARPESNLAATCIYFFPADVEPDLARYLAAGGEPDAPGHFIAWLAQQRSVHAVPFEGIAHDIGDRASLERARVLYASRD